MAHTIQISIKYVIMNILSFHFQGLWMGLQITMGSASRVLAPLTITNLYTQMGPTYAIGMVAICMVLVFCANALAFKRMIPLGREAGEGEGGREVEEEGGEGGRFGSSGAAGKGVRLFCQDPG